jgi:uncharacterized phiE125 gp8 family phage protein
MLTLNELKAALRVDFTTDDKELLRLLDAAIAYCELQVGFTFSTNSQTVYLKDWEDALILSSDSLAVKYNSGISTVVTMTSGVDYWVDRSDGLVLKFINKPVVYLGTQPSITHTTGYSALPSDLQQAIVGLVGHWYSNVEAVSVDSMQHVPLSTQALLDMRRKKGNLR